MSEAPSIVQFNLAQSRREKPRADSGSVLWSALDRKYAALGEMPRRVLHRVAVFVGEFTSDAACDVVTGAGLHRAGVAAGIAVLVAGSLLERVWRGDSVGARYILSLPTREFALGKLTSDGELDLVARNHARYLQCVLEYAEVEFDRREPCRWLAHYACLLDDVRAALDWAFSASGDPTIGVDLTVAAIPLWLSSSQSDELQHRIGRALKSGAATTHSGRQMRLRTAARLAGMSNF
jgi:predicted ATPase